MRVFFHLKKKKRFHTIETRVEMSKSTPVVRRAGDFDCIPRGCRYWTAESNNAGRTEKEIQTRRRLFLITRLSSRQFDSPASFVSSKISDGQSSIKDGHLFECLAMMAIAPIQDRTIK